MSPERSAFWLARENAVLTKVVDFFPATTTKFEDDHYRTEVYRYRGRAPPVSTYENGERRFRVRRATRPLVERLDD
ncbi:hypothetical protein [Salinigranum sp. GCM10025319]|uniref:hypothetical protein n=1 Tax=Salinigranum sp. GCM10025319 TaxID=3252687 RepID=UPI0036204FC7